jgi:hypothetical protein
VGAGETGPFFLLFAPLLLIIAANNALHNQVMSRLWPLFVQTIGTDTQRLRLYVYSGGL